MTEDTDKKVNQLQMYEQSIHTILLQKQQFQSQISESESALKELESSPVAYRIMGNIMVSVGKDELRKELSEKKTTAELRIKSLEKQELSIKEKASALQAEVLGKMKDE